MMRRFVILIHILSLPFWGVGQSCGLADTIFILPNTTTNIPLQIADFFNNNLADPNQGLCGVELQFFHQFSENMEVWLSSPAGQTIQLIGPNTDDQLAFTFGARWRITFVPAAVTAVPDSGYVARWDNDQQNNFINGGTYTGSYYPYNGNLENFNTGPVNGTWTVQVRNNPSLYAGAFVFIRLIFCDSRGVECCFAKPGQLTNPDVLACEGDSLLRMDPTLVFPGGRPDTTRYGYAFMIGSDSILSRYDTLIDLRTFPAGHYQVCGLSYAWEDSLLLPVPDGMLTIDSIRRNLDGLEPDFCGRITPQCVEVRIVAPPAPVNLDTAICTGESFAVGDSIYTAAGDYSVTLRNFAGCDSVVNLRLSLLPIPETFLNPVICEGDSFPVGNAIYTRGGFYLDTLIATTGCDSIIQLELTVLAPVDTMLTQTICAGDTVYIHGLPYYENGSFSLTIPSAQGCDSTVFLDLTVVDISVAIAAPDTITCTRAQVILDGAASGPPGMIAFSWTDASGALLGNDPTLTVDEPGWYFLEVSRSLNGTACSRLDSVWVPANLTAPLADAGPPDTLTCARPQVLIGGNASSQGPGFRYQWQTDTGRFLTGTDQRQAMVDAAGRYELFVIDLGNGCRDTSVVDIAIDTLAPLAEAGPPAVLNCAVNSVTLDGSQSSSGAAFRYSWTGPCPVSAPDSARVTVNCPGTFFLEVTNGDNGCQSRDSVTVAEDRQKPSAVVQPPDTLTCLQPVISLDGAASGPAARIRYLWTDPFGQVLDTTPQVPVSEGGGYRLVVTDTVNFCRDTAMVNVVADTIPPTADAGPDQLINCYQPLATLGGAATSLGPGLVYQWEQTEGRITGPADAPFTQTDTSGLYWLIVTNTANGCTDTSFARIAADLNPPFADAGSDLVIFCGTDSFLLDAADSDTSLQAIYRWEGPCIIGGQDSLVATANCPGSYTLAMTNPANGCSATDTILVTLSGSAPVASVPDTARISCITGNALLDGNASSPGLYEWSFGGMVIASNVREITVTQGGWYTLTVANLDGTCVATDSILVVQDCQPLVSIATPGQIICGREIVTLAAAVSPQGPEYTYTWIPPADGCLQDGQGSAAAQVSCGGDYLLIVNNPILALSDTARVTVFRDLNVPVAEAGPADTLNCVKSVASLQAAGSSAGPDILYVWTESNNGDTLGFGPSLTVAEPGIYFLEVVDTANLCRSSDFVQVFLFDSRPVVNFGSTFFPCDRDTFALEAFVSPVFSHYEYLWSGDHITGARDSAVVWVDSLGTFSLYVLNTLSQCDTVVSVTVTDQICAPCLETLAPDTLSCSVGTVGLTASFCAPCVGCTVEWTTTDGRIESGAGLLTATVSQAGTYRITATDTLGFSSFAELTVIAQTTPPDVDAGPDRLLTCDSTSVTLGGPATATGPGLVYKWSSINGADIEPDPPAFARVRQPGTFQLQVIDTLSGCQATDVVVVTLDTLPPLAEAGPGMTITCADPQVFPDGAGSTLGNQIAYRWFSANPAACLQGDTTLNPIISCPGVYFLEVRNNANGCAGLDSVIIGQSADLPVLQPLPDTALTCGHPTLDLLGATPAPTGYDFRWCPLDANGQVLSGQCRDSLSLRVDQAGLYRFEVTDRNTGCRNGFTVQVRSDVTPPFVDAGPTDTLLCTMAGIRLQGSAGPASDPLVYEWTALQGGVIENRQVLQPLVFSPDTFVLTVTNLSNQCQASDTVIIARDVNAPIAEAGTDSLLSCLLTRLRLQGQATTAAGNAQFLWQTDGGRILAGANTLQPDIDQPGWYFFTVTDSQNGCTATDSLWIGRDIRKPSARIAGIDTLQLSCRVDTLILNASPSVTASGMDPVFSWQTRGSGRLFPDLGAPVVQTDATGNYRLIVSDPANGCRDSLNFSVNGDFAAPRIALAPPDPLTCANRQVMLDAAGSDLGTGFSAQWLFQSQVLATDTPQVSVAVPGVYVLRIMDNGNGCMAIDSLSVETDTIAPIAVVAAPDFLDCEVRSVILDGSASSKGPLFRFSWTSEVPGGVLSGQEKLVAEAGAPGWYLLTVTNLENGCMATDSTLVEEIALPITGLAVNVRPAGCEGAATGALIVTGVIGGTAPFRFSLNGSVFREGGSYEGLLPGTYTLTVSDLNGCQWDSLLTVPIPEAFTVNLGPDVTIALGDTLTLSAQVSHNGISRVTWEPTDPDWVDPGSLDQQVSPLETTVYGITLVDTNGCVARDKVIISVGKTRKYFIPSAFSPDGDGNNDVLFINTGPEVAAVRSFRIFDRWGNQVFGREAFQPNDPAYGWDGHFQGRPMNAAVYVYFAELEYVDGWVEMVKGDVALLR